MITKIIETAYDSYGKRILKPRKYTYMHWHPDHTMEYYANCNIKNKFSTIEELRIFLIHCKYVSDKEQFNKEDYWMAPTDFEITKRGDCDDFALYIWRQFMEMGFKTRFTIGDCSRYDTGHAWVTLSINGQNYLVEPLARGVKQLPRFFQLKYKPMISVELVDNKLRYFQHSNYQYNPAIKELFIFSFEWLFFYLRVILKFMVRIIQSFLRKINSSLIGEKV